MKFTKKNLWLQPDKICIAHGAVVARNLMFESQLDHKLFLDLWQKYLGGMTKMLNYHLTPDNWTILFKTNSSEEIVLAYNKQRNRSKKANQEFLLTDPKRMLSEHIRIFLSQYARTVNRNKNRKGALVLERFRKYIIHSHADYRRIFMIISNQIRFPSQEESRFRADESEYDVLGEMKYGSKWQVGFRGVFFGDAVLNSTSVIVGRLLNYKSLSSVLRNFWISNNRPKPPPQ